MKTQNLKLKTKNYKSKLKTFYLLVALFTFYFLLFTFPVRAQELSVGISPPIFQIEAEAPTQVQASLFIENLTDASASYSIFLVPFNNKFGGQGEIEFDREKFGEYKEVFDNVSILDEDRAISSVTLGPNEERELMLSIIVTPEIEAKDYYFTIIFVSGKGPTLQRSGVSTKGGIGTNVLLSVGPKTKIGGLISGFSTPKFITRGPVEFSLAVTNTGSNFVNIDGTVVVKNIFGQTIGSVNLLPVNILARSKRLMESENNKNKEPKVVWDERFLLGIYEAEAVVKLSDEGPILKEKIRFFALPVEAIIGFSVLVFISIFIIGRVKAKRDEEI